MLETSNYKFPIYERNDVLSVLLTYNNSIKSIDSAIHAAMEKATSGSENIDSLQTEVKNIKTRLDTAESELTTLSETLATAVTTVSEHEEKIASMSTDLINQNKLVNEMNTNVTNLLSNVETLKTNYTALDTRLSNLSKSQEAKNSEFSSEISDLSKLGCALVPFTGQHNGVTSGSQTWLDVFTIDLSKLSNFTISQFRKTTLTLQVNKRVANENKGNYLINFDYSTNSKQTTILLQDGTITSITITFNDSTKTVVIRLTGSATADKEPTTFYNDVLASVTWNKSNLSQ